MPADHDNVFETLVESTVAFYRRFAVTPMTDEMIRVFREEVGELIEAAQEGTDRNHIAEEAADVIVTVLGLCLACGVDPITINEGLTYVAAKNDAKTHATHHYKDGKIRRRE